GGIVDVEFLVQLFQLKYGHQRPSLRTGNTWHALDALKAEALIAEPEHQAFWSSYDFLREVESCLRIVHNRSLDELPEKPEDLEKLAGRLGIVGDGGTAASKFVTELDRRTTEVRELFLKLAHRERSA